MQLNLVADIIVFADTQVSKKQKLLDKLQCKPDNFTWDEATKLMGLCDFDLVKKKGSARMFVHKGTKTKVRLHEPHPQPTLLTYMMDRLIEGLIAAGEL